MGLKTEVNLKLIVARLYKHRGGENKPNRNEDGLRMERINMDLQTTNLKNLGIIFQGA